MLSKDLPIISPPSFQNYFLVIADPTTTNSFKVTIEAVATYYKNLHLDSTFSTFTNNSINSTSYILRATSIATTTLIRFEQTIDPPKTYITVNSAELLRITTDYSAVIYGSLVVDNIKANTISRIEATPGTYGRLRCETNGNISIVFGSDTLGLSVTAPDRGQVVVKYGCFGIPTWPAVTSPASYTWSTPISFSNPVLLFNFRKDVTSPGLQSDGAIILDDLGYYLLHFNMRAWDTAFTEDDVAEFGLFSSPTGATPIRPSIIVNAVQAGYNFDAPVTFMHKVTTAGETLYLRVRSTIALSWKNEDVWGNTKWNACFAYIIKTGGSRGHG